MAEYAGCICEEREDGTFALSDIALPNDTVEHLYLGPGGIYAIAPPETDAEGLYLTLKGLLGAVYIFLYIKEKGCYDPRHGFQECLYDDRQLTADISNILHQSPLMYTQSALERMRRKLIERDAYTRGYYRDADGTLYIKRHGQFRRASEVDPDQCFYLTVFFGWSGFHRFFLGKFFSGFIYLLTCGFFLAGWFMDLLYLFMGIQRDHSKAFVLPLKGKKTKAFQLTLWAAIAVTAAMIYAQFYSLLFHAIFSGIAATDPSSLQGIGQSFPHLIDFFGN